MACVSLSSVQFWGSSGASIVPFFFNPLKGQVVCFEKQQLLAAKSHCSLALLSTAVLHFPRQVWPLPWAGAGHPQYSSILGTQGEISAGPSASLAFSVLFRLPLVRSSLAYQEKVHNV